MAITEQNVGIRLREVRDLRGFSQKDLAHLTGVAAPVISQIEHGRHVPRLVVLVGLFNALGFELELVYREGRDADDPLRPE